MIHTNRIATGFLLTMGILLLGCQGNAKNNKQRQKNADGFNAIRQQVIKGEYQAAIPRLKKFLDEHGDSVNASRCGLFLFKCYFAELDFPNAKEWCQWTIEKHPSSLEAHKCRYKLAMVLLVEGKRDEARKRFSDLALTPDGPLAAEAKAMANYLGKAVQ